MGLYRDHGKENGNYCTIIGHILETYWGYMDQMDKQMEHDMETVILQGLYWGNLRVVLGLYGDNGKEHGNY